MRYSILLGDYPKSLFFGVLREHRINVAIYVVADALEVLGLLTLGALRELLCSWQFHLLLLLLSFIIPLHWLLMLLRPVLRLRSWRLSRFEILSRLIMFTLHVRLCRVLLVLQRTLHLL